MAWSIFTASQGGGEGSAVTWAEDLLTQIGAPLTPGNEQFVYDWEKSEGGGGKYNPLNQGPVPGQPQLTTTGSQYGGGASDYASWAAGLEGSADYLKMANFKSIGVDLIGNDPIAARQALIASPWAASHYGNGSAFSNAALPGQATALPATGGSVTSTPATSTTPASSTLQLDSFSSWLPWNWGSDAVSAGIKAGAYIGLLLAGVGLVVLGVDKAAGGGHIKQQLSCRAGGAAPAAAAGGSGGAGSSLPVEALAA